MSLFEISGVCIVGAGHAAHASIVLFDGVNHLPNIRVFSAHNGEASRLQDAIGLGHISAMFAPHLFPSGLKKGKPCIITNDPKEALQGVNVVVMPLPSFAYEGTLRLLKPHLKTGTVVLATPGQGGIHWFAKDILGDKLNDLLLCTMTPMPFNCRVVQFGKHVDIQAFKKKYYLCSSKLNDEQIKIAHSVTRQLYGYFRDSTNENTSLLLSSSDVVVGAPLMGEPNISINHTDKFAIIRTGHLIDATLFPLNACIHPQRLYSLLKTYKPGDILTSNPLFYEEMTKEAIDLMEETSNELALISKSVETYCGISINVLSILEAELLTYESGNIDNNHKFKSTPSSSSPTSSNSSNSPPIQLIDIFRSNPNYRGFRCPYKPCSHSYGSTNVTKLSSGDGGGGNTATTTHSCYIPDVSNRYFTEDIPYGLCVWKGIAEICQVETPTIDTIIHWAQAMMHKDYISPSLDYNMKPLFLLNGKDVIETGAPQRFGITDPTQLL